MQTQHLTLDQISSYLLNNSSFIKSIFDKVQPTNSYINYPSNFDIEAIVQQISDIVMNLIEEKLKRQMQNLIADNNAILEQIRKTIQQNTINNFQKKIQQQRAKVFQSFHNVDLDKSLSLIEQSEQLTEKLNELQKKVRAMEEKYETNFKSLWNVMSMTEAAVFEHVRENKVIKLGNNLAQDKLKNDVEISEKSEKSESKIKEKEKSFFNFWKN